jgi:hypothetical protein
MCFYIHAYSRWIARVGVGFNFLKLPPPRKAEKTLGEETSASSTLSVLSLQKQPKWQNRCTSRIFKQTGKQTKGALCVTILVPFENVCSKYLYSIYLFGIHCLEKLISFTCAKSEKICCTLGWHLIRKSIVFT